MPCPGSEVEDVALSAHCLLHGCHVTDAMIPDLDVLRNVRNIEVVRSLTGLPVVDNRDVCSSLSSARVRLLPMNPRPPVTRQFMLL